MDGSEVTPRRTRRPRRITEAMLEEARESLKLVYGLPPFEQDADPFPDPGALRDIREIYCKPYNLSLQQLEERTGIDLLRRQWERIRDAGLG